MPFKPPRSANLLLQWALPAEDLEVIAGDLEEIARYGSRAARRRCRRAPLVLAAGPQHRVCEAAQARGRLTGSLAEDAHGSVQTGLYLRGAVSSQTAGIHRDGRRHAGARHRRDRRDLRAGQRRHPEAAAVRGSRSPHARALALASAGGRRAASDDLVVSQVPGVSRPSACVRIDGSVRGLELESHRLRFARAPRWRDGGRELFSGASLERDRWPDVRRGGDAHARIPAARHPRPPDLDGAIWVEHRDARPRHRAERDPTHYRGRDARGLSRADGAGRSLGPPHDAIGR